jgi:hypothetical protein
MQPFVTERVFPVNAAEKFKHNLDPALIPFFNQHYPSYTAVVPLEAVHQLPALQAMLSAAQAAKDSRQNISNAALTAINTQGFMMTPLSGAQADASQAETTITAYRRAEIICFGCGQTHPWSKKQDDDTYVVICPNKAKPGVEAAAAVKIAEMKVKRKAQRQGRKDKKNRKPLQTPPLRH